ncbi:MAG: hypothetical protein ABS939_22425 [Psychrobacillus sp.]|uniref:hypothetical protein n=1 Tax=Solibacillus sp. FSL R7-0682 TaxID=2921690 RepID=UPI0030F9C4B1
MEENKIQYLQLIQNVITRMASNSFMLKGWTVTLVVGLLAFANVSEMESKYIILALVPAIMFWVLDGFFIYQEKLYRDLYNNAIKLKNDEIDFSLNPIPFKKLNKRSWFKGIFSKTLWIFYLPIIVVIICALILF